MSVRWGAGFPPKSLSSPPTSPTGFVLIPSPVILLSHLLSPVHIGQSVCVCVCVCVTGATGMHAQCPLKPFVLQIYTVLPLFPMPISPLLVRQCMQCRAYNGRTRIGSFPLLTLPSEVSEVYSSRCFFTAQGFFFPRVWETVALALVPVNPRWESPSGFFSVFWEVWADWCML